MLELCSCPTSPALLFTLLMPQAEAKRENTILDLLHNLMLSDE
jgi:hypothetical protein